MWLMLQLFGWSHRINVLVASLSWSDNLIRLHLPALNLESYPPPRWTLHPTFASTTFNHLVFVVHPAALIPVQPHHFPFTTGISFRLYKLTGRLPLVITSVPLIYHSCRRVLTANILFQRLFTTNFPRASFFCYSFLLANQGVGHSLDYTLRFN